MFNSPYVSNYMQNYSQQNLNDRIDSEIAKLQQIKTNMNQQQTNQQQPAINQTIQLAPNRDFIRYANNIDEVGKDVVTGDTPFFSRDMSIVWIKNANGEIKTYELNEVVLKDEKDMKIDLLMAQIEDLKRGMMKYESNTNVVESSESKESTDVSTISKSTKTKK